MGALLATSYYNWYPAKILVGDVGILTIGAIIVSAVIIGNYEAAGVILMIPYMVDFLIKARIIFLLRIGGEYIRRKIILLG